MLCDLVERIHDLTDADQNRVWAIVEEWGTTKILISGALQALTDESDREAVIRGVAAGLSEDDMARLLVLAPFGKATWKLVGTLGGAAQAGY